MILMKKAGKVLRSVLKFIFSRLMLEIILVVLQVYVLFSWIYSTALAYQITTLLNVFSIILVIFVINEDEDPSFKLGWTVMILALPIFGGMMYLLCAGRKMPKKLSKGTTMADKRMQNLLEQDPQVMEDLQDKPHMCKMFSNALRSSNFPVWSHTDATYFKSGEEWFPVFLEEPKKAKHFIFIEYFIIDLGSSWDEVLAILKQKVSEGVEVKLIYDDFGCMGKLPWHTDRKLNQMGIETYRFNPVRPALIVQMNNRDHRKICVIDNNVAFTGGVNIADEYMNRIERYGYWKDSAVMIHGQAVWSMTVMFLGMYSYLKHDTETIDYLRYRIDCDPIEDKGLFQPFSDTPTDDTDVGLSMHLNLVNLARDYVYIDTPYLILNHDMETALKLAVANGVDVRIMTPHIPDKHLVFLITRANYEPLLKAGVKIYEYTPGFNHCKNIVSDDRIGLCGSVNTDYRSYFLHFEDGIMMYNSPAVMDMKKDFMDSLKQSQEVTLQDCQNVNLFVRLFSAVLRLMAMLF
jgi:cardiolipin synthase